MIQTKPRKMMSRILPLEVGFFTATYLNEPNSGKLSKPHETRRVLYNLLHRFASFSTTGSSAAQWSFLFRIIPTARLAVDSGYRRCLSCPLQASILFSLISSGVFDQHLKPYPLATADLNICKRDASNGASPLLHQFQ